MDILKMIFEGCNNYYGHETVRTICKTIIEVTKILTQKNKTSVEIEEKKTQE